MKSDDFTLPVEEQQHIREHADRLLREANAYGKFPTPVKSLVAAAKLRVKYLDELPQIQNYDPQLVKRALSKLQGFLHREDQMIFLDRSLITSRRKFIALHEVAHEWLPDQRDLFKILEDSEMELDSETLDLFERSANCFASDVLFQLDRFSSDAKEAPLGIGAPIKELSKRYGAGIYSTLRRYTEACGKPAALLVCDQILEGGIMPVRRFVASSQFLEEFGQIQWPEGFHSNSWFFRNRPRQRFGLPSPFAFSDFERGSINSMFLIESYNSTRQIFFFIYPMRFGLSGTGIR